MERKEKKEFLYGTKREMLQAPIISQRAFQQKKRKKLKKALFLYLFTMTAIVVAVTILIISCSFEYSNSYLSGGAFSLSKFIVNADFMDIAKDRFADSSFVGSIIDVVNGVLKPSEKLPDKQPEAEEESDKNQDAESLSKDTIYNFDYLKVPDGETPVLPMDLSMYSYGAAYIHNSTGLAPDTEALLKEYEKVTITE